MAKFIEYTTLDRVIYGIVLYISTRDKKYLEDIQPEILLAKEIDESIKTKAEYKNNIPFIASSHNPARMAVFLLNYFGEHYLNKGELTIKADDPSDKYTNKHNNTYLLELKDADTHEKLYEGNPTSEDEPYDFNSVFIKQITCYPDKNVDTTSTSWESFVHATNLRPGYFIPKRTFDFKSAFWKSGSEHNVNYILKLDFDKQLKLFNRVSKVEKEIEFKPAANTSYFYTKYFELLNVINYFNQHKITWEECILNYEV